MGNIIQHLRGSVVDHSTYTGKKGEISLVTDASEARIPTGEIRIHDDSTPGGLPLVLGTTTNPLTSDIVLGSGVGINFHNYGTGVDSNLLDDYEEGTWTPVVSDASTGGNIATLSSSTDGVYTKIGDIVYFRFNVVLSNKGSMTAANTVFIQGFPFQSASIPGNWYNPFPVIIRSTTFSGYVQFHQNQNTTYGYFRENVSGGTGDNIYVSYLTNASAMQVAGFYKVS